MSVSIELSGLTDFQSYVDRLPEVSRRAAVMAINQTAQRKALPLARTEIASQIAFGETYLKDPTRLGVTKAATGADLEAVITGRDRPTSLARFAAHAPFPTPPKTGVQVKVKPGKTKTMKSAFIVKLPQGKGGTETNRGLAIRMAEGVKLKKSDGPFAVLAPNVYLLYGPSVNQVFREVRVDVLTPVAEYLADEFLRQWARLAGE